MEKKIKAILFLLLSGNICSAYTPPRGIPSPPFGLNEDVDDYVGSTYDFTLDGRGVLTYPISSVSGQPYTHYVDSTHPSATDTSNPYGTESLPRLTLPFELDKNPNTAALQLAEGSIIEIHGGPYEYDPALFPGGWDGISVYSKGTSSNPVFIRGAVGDEPVMRENVANRLLFYLAGQYLIVENIEFQNVSLKLRPVSYTPIACADYVAVRNCTLTGNGEVVSHSGIEIQGGATDAITYVTIYNNSISYYGQYDWTDIGDENDAHGVAVNVYSNHIWVLDNHMHHNGGDSMQIGNAASRNTTYVYIGDNTFHDDRENPVDIKQAQDVIVSHNVFYNYTEEGRADDGMGVIIHQGGSLATSPDYIWIIFNEIYNTTYYGVGMHSGEHIYIIGNLIYNVPDTTPDGNSSRGIRVSQLFGGETHYYVNNTIYNCEAGFWRDSDTDYHAKFVISNNIVDTLSEGISASEQAHIWIEPVVTNTEIEYNLFNQTDSTVCLRWENTDYTSIASFQSASGTGGNCLFGDPLFTNPGSDFSLQAESPGKGTADNSGNAKDAYDAFENRYGINIKYGFNDNPLSGSWDMGAFQGPVRTRYLLFHTN